MTLQCLEFVEEESRCKSSAIAQVAMKQCKKTDGQYIVKDNHNLHPSKLCGGKKYYLRLATKREGEGYRAFSQRNVRDSWFNEDKNLRLHWEHIPYRGECHKYESKQVYNYETPFKIKFMPTDQLKIKK